LQKGIELTGLEFVLVTLGVIYFAIIAFLGVGIRRIRSLAVNNSSHNAKVSVLIPARNEANNIEKLLNSLANQTYPKDSYEVVVIDDHSSDGTSEVAQKYIKENHLSNFRVLVHQTNGVKKTYKKDALAFAIPQSSGEIIMTVDADCQVLPTWIASTVSKFSPTTGLVAGLITFNLQFERNLFHKLQTLEFAGLVFCGVGALGNNYPLICNGSNLAYRRQTYLDVGGYEGHQHIASGDDDLFMQNIHRITEWEVVYNLDAGAINTTKPVKTLRQFYHQRARWGSKSREYPGAATFFLLLSIYLFYVGLFLSPLLWWTGQLSLKTLAALMALKMLPEYWVIRQALEVLNRKDLQRYFLLAQLFQVPYIVIAGFAGFFKIYRWK
jgi:cellulose synthase/poly-beta-1,6-N-acetylglucosamine synthase-like glycosyltransferase